jgi:transcription antitermination factor NusG
LPQETLDELRDRAASDGVIRFESRRKRKFNVGATINARAGAFAGFTGTVERLESKDRVSVLFGLFGRKTTVTMREADITAG